MFDPAEGNLREQYAAAQKNRILQAAARVFEANGYERATTKKIAAEAGLSEGALFHHFKTKRDLLLGVLELIIGSVRQAPTGRAPSEQAVTGHAPAEQAPTDRGSTEQGSASQASDDHPAARRQDYGDDLRSTCGNAVRERLSRAQPHMKTLFALLSDILTDPDLSREVYRTLFAPSIERLETFLRRFSDRGEVSVSNIPVTARLLYAVALGIDVLSMMGDRCLHEALSDPREFSEVYAQLILDGIARPNSISDGKKGD